MRRYLLLFVTAFTLVGTSCKKYNQVDNSGTVKTPYTLFIGGFYGTMHKTNDGLYFNNLFPTDNSCVRQIIVADSNLLYLKENLYVSDNEGQSFKVCNQNVIPFMDAFYKYYLPNTGLYNKTERKVYICVKNGVEVSSDLGKTFSAETNWATPFPAGEMPTSVTLTDNGTMYLMIDSTNQFVKAPGGQWAAVAQDGVNDLPTDTTTWYVSKSHDTLFAVDFNGRNGIFYSTNFGADWATISGIPKKRKILFANQPEFSDNFYVGIDSGGLYRLDGANFFFNTAGAGMPWSTKVSYVEGKRIIYRTDVVRKYLFAATDEGLFISETGGLDWRVLRTGSYSTLR